MSKVSSHSGLTLQSVKSNNVTVSPFKFKILSKTEAINAIIFSGKRQCEKGQGLRHCEYMPRELISYFENPVTQSLSIRIN
jgi:hypothetical protein